MRRGFITALLVMLLFSFLSALLQAASQAVPDAWLRGGRLAVPELNFAVNAPAPSARWSYEEHGDVQGSKATVFIAATPSEENYILVVLEKRSRRSLDASNTKSFVDGMLKSLPRGWRVRDVDIGSASVPVSNSSRFTATIQLPDDSIVYQHGYIVTGKRTYILAAYDPDATESLKFKQFVASFTLLNPAANITTFSFREDSIRIGLGLFSLCVLFTMVGDIVLVIRQSSLRRATARAKFSVGPAVDPSILADLPPHPERLRRWGLFQIIVGVFTTVVAGMGTSIGKDTAYVVGSITGAFLWPVGIAYFVHGRKRARDWNRFARLFFWLCVFNPGLIFKSAARVAKM